MKRWIIQPFLFLLVFSASTFAEEFLYLEPFLDMRGFDGEVEVYTEDYEFFFLSLESLKEVLKVDITIENDQINGWYFFQNNVIRGNRKRGSVMVKDVEHQIAGRDFIEVDGQYFASQALIQKWFDVKVMVEINRLLINFDTQGRHPYFESMKRKSRYGALDKLKAKEREVAVFDNQYQWFTAPVSDIRINHSSGQTSQTGLVASAVFDLAGHGVDFLSSHANGQNNYRFSAKREGMIADNPYHYQLGDVFFPAGNFIRGSFSGRGIALMGNPLSRNYSRNFQVEGLPGWEVELYRDDQLIDYSALDQLGQYQFEGVDISAGHNEYKAVLYGPNGEIREQRFNFNVTNAGVFKGKWLPELYLIEPDQPTFGEPLRQSNFGYTAIGRLHYGLTNNLNVGGGVINDFSDSDKRTAFAEMLYVGKSQVFDFGLGAPAMADGLSYSANYSLNTDFGTFVLSSYDAFIYEQSSFQQAHSARWQQTGQVYDMSLGFSRLNFGLTPTTQVDASLGVRFDDNHLSNRLSFTDKDNFRLNTLARIKLGEQLLQLRGDIERTQGQTEQQLYAAWRKQFGRYNLNVTSNYKTRDNSLGFSAELSGQFDSMRFGLRVSHDPTQKLTVALTMSTAFSWDAPFASFNRNSYNQSARVKVRSFKDNNFNQRFDDGDEPLNGVRLVTADRLKVHKNEQGTQTLYGLQSYRPQYLEVNTDNLEDPFVSPLKEKFQITSHPGGEVSIDIPFYDIFEVEGEVQIRNDEGKTTGKGGVPLYLVKQGQIIKEIKTEYDGYFLFDKVLPGEYQVVIASHWLEQKALVVDSGVDLTLSLTSGADAMVVMDTIVLNEQQSNEGRNND